jgi:long-chain acyl-CoA synthetase
MKTIIDLFEESVKQFPDNIYLWQKTGDAYQGISYSETRNRVYEFASGLIKLGLMPGDRVVLLSEGRNDWVISELSILYNRAVNVPLSIKLSEPEEIAFRLKHSGARLAIVSNKQLQKILDALPSAPELELIISLDYVETNDTRIRYVEDIIDIGRKFYETQQEEFEKRYRSVRDDDIANICYTSGTTADPKGIILTHRNYTANVEHSGSLHSIPEHYITLLILPWDHSFAHTCGIYSIMKYGASLASVQLGSTALETLKNVPKNIKEIKPAFILSVPALAKNFRKNIEKAIQEKGPVAEKLFRFALQVAYRYNGLGWDRGKGFRIFLWPFCKLFDIILFKKVREGFGGRLKFFVGGGALLDIELQRFFYAIGIPMYQGYGLTEASPVISSNNPKKLKMGSSGVVAKNMIVKIFDNDGKELPVGENGEIVVQGENVMKGYWHNDPATKETLKNGWLHTGDMGYLDMDGFLYVLGRFKSLLIADDGEKFSPEGIEEAFTDNSAYIEQCMMYNNQKPYSVCLVIPNREALKKYLTDNKIDPESAPESALLLIDKELSKYRKKGEYADMFPQRWLPVAIAVLSEGFTEENRLLNSTMKMVRPKITEKYQKLLDYLYTPEAKKITNPRNLSEISKRLG